MPRTRPVETAVHSRSQRLSRTSTFRSRSIVILSPTGPITALPANARRDRPGLVRTAVAGLVALVRLAVPDLHAVEHADHHRLLADADLAAQPLRDEQTPLGVEVHRLGLAEEHPRVGARLGIGEREVADLARALLPLGPGEAEETAVLAERQHGAVRQDVTEPSRQADPALRVERVAMRAE